MMTKNINLMAVTILQIMYVFNLIVKVFLDQPPF
jgi:hypothetical protein